VDVEHFARVDSSEVHHRLSQLPHPRIGFIGLIYEKLDFRLLARVAERFSQGSVVMIGPVDYCDARLSRMPNVHFMGKQPYDDLPRWMVGLDALVLPYLVDDMIRQSGPLKLRECLAAGKPTVSVDVPEVRIMQPHVRVAATHEEFLSELEQAVSATELASDRLLRRQAILEDDWDCRAERLERLIESL
jgi:glycosyltransferase involved in cell wall biosynthesis